MMDIDTPYKEKQAARYLGISESVLRLWRYDNRGPRYFRAGEKLVRYRKQDLDEWINARLNETAQVA